MKLNWSACRLRALWLAILVLVTARETSAQRDKPFVPFQGVQSTIEASPLVLAAYAFVWAALIVYVFLLWRRIGRVEHELADVNAKLSARKRP